MLNDDAVLQDQSDNIDGDNSQNDATEAVSIADATFASAVRATRQKWILHGLVPAKAITILTGRGGVGKSTLAAGIAAHCTKGRDLTPRRKGEIFGRVAWFAAEESISASTVPKLKAAGCKMGKVLLPGVSTDGRNATTFNFTTDSYRVEQLIKTMDVRLAIVDPLISYCSSVDVNNAQAMRSVLSMLARISDRCNVSWLLIVHPNKSKRGNAVERIGGSGAISQCARSIICLHQFPSEPDTRYLFHCKSNCGPMCQTASLDFQLSASNGYPSLRFVDWSTKNVDDMDGDSEDGVEGDVMKDALELLRKMLASDFVPSTEVMKEAKQAGIGERTLRKAKLSLGVVARRISEGINSGYWEWGFHQQPEP